MLETQRTKPKVMPKYAMDPAMFAAYVPDEEDPIFGPKDSIYLGGRGAPATNSQYASLGVPPASPRSQSMIPGMGAAPPAPSRAYGSLDALPEMQQQGIMNISYAAPDGNQYQISAKFNQGDRNQVVDGLMKCAYHLVMMGGDGYGKNKPSAGLKGPYSGKGLGGYGKGGKGGR